MHGPLDRNFTLQKQLEKSRERLERDFKASQRKMRHVVEDCVSFTYQLLHEAIVKEKESVRKRQKNLGIITNNINKEAKTSTAETTITFNKPRIRPQTAGLDRDRNNRISRKRPSSAHPLLPSDETLEDDQIIQVEAKPKKAWSIVSQRTKQSTNSQCHINNEKVNANHRPKTADFYRKKQPESEIATYWTEKVRSVIAKWDLQDKEDYNDDSRSEPVIKGRLLTPNTRKVVLTESERKLKAFVRRFGSQYRTQMKLSTLQNNEHLTKGGRKTHFLSKHELAGIHADTVRRLNNAEKIVKKSLEIRMNMERNTKYLNGITSTDPDS